MNLRDLGPRQRRLVQLSARSHGLGATALLNRSGSQIPTEGSIEPAHLLALEQFHTGLRTSASVREAARCAFSCGRDAAFFSGRVGLVAAPTNSHCSAGSLGRVHLAAAGTGEDCAASEAVYALS
jgi:hypothetical protein